MSGIDAYLFISSAFIFNALTDTIIIHNLGVFMNSYNLQNFREGLRDGIPIALGYLAVSFTLGIAARNFGIHALPATIMSLTNFTSAGEFAALSIISVGASYLELALSQLIINLRYLLMSCALSQKLSAETSLFHRFWTGFFITDEIFGVSSSRPGKLNPFYTYGTAAVAIPGWALGTCLGVILGTALPARITRALSVALYGMFLAVIIPPARKNKVIAGLVIVAMLCSSLFSYLPFLADISTGMKVIILTVLLSGAAAILFPVKETEEDAK